MSLVPGSDVTVPDDAGGKLTYDDLVALPDDRLRHELIDGEHYVTPSPNLKHQAVAPGAPEVRLYERLARITHTSARGSHSRPR